jgi:hypothetical protein
MEEKKGVRGSPRTSLVCDNAIDLGIDRGTIWEFYLDPIIFSIVLPAYNSQGD